MGGYRIEHTEDPARAREAAAPFLLRRPVEHNLLLSILGQRTERPSPGRYWWVVGDQGEVVGFALLSPLDFYAAVTRMPADAVPALVAAVAARAPGLRGVNGEACTVAVFGGQWSEQLGAAVAPLEAHRLYRLDRPPHVPTTPGTLRPASTGDEELLVAWARAFQSEIGLPYPGDIAEATRQRMAAGGLWLWDEGRPVSAVGVTSAIAGVARIHYVYTPPEHRRKGHATACVAAVSVQALAAGAQTCVLYTQLNNATSNRIYRTLGYRAAMDLLLYGFGSDGSAAVGPTSRT